MSAHSKTTMSLEQLKVELRAYIMSSKKGLTIHQLEQDFRDVNGCSVPFWKFGFRNLEEVLRKMAQENSISFFTGNGQTLLKAISDESTEHLDKLVHGQKKSNPTRMGGTILGFPRRNKRRTRSLPPPRFRNENRSPQHNSQVKQRKRTPERSSTPASVNYRCEEYLPGISHSVSDVNNARSSSPYGSPPMAWPSLNSPRQAAQHNRHIKTECHLQNSSLAQERSPIREPWPSINSGRNTSTWQPLASKESSPAKSLKEPNKNSNSFSDEESEGIVPIHESIKRDLVALLNKCPDNRMKLRDMWSAYRTNTAANGRSTSASMLINTTFLEEMKDVFELEHTKDGIVVGLVSSQTTVSKQIENCSHGVVRLSLRNMIGETMESDKVTAVTVTPIQQMKSKSLMPEISTPIYKKSSIEGKVSSSSSPSPPKSIPPSVTRKSAGQKRFKSETKYAQKDGTTETDTPKTIRSILKTHSSSERKCLSFGSKDRNEEETQNLLTIPQKTKSITTRVDENANDEAVKSENFQLFDQSNALRKDPLIMDFAQRVAAGKADLKTMEITLNMLKINKKVAQVCQSTTQVNVVDIRIEALEKLIASVKV